MCPATRDQAGLAALEWVNMIPDPGKTVSLITGANRAIGREVWPSRRRWRGLMPY